MNDRSGETLMSNVLGILKIPRNKPDFHDDVALSVMSLGFDDINHFSWFLSKLIHWKRIPLR
jgi:hypothetical protein